MHKRFVFALSGCLFLSVLQAQDNAIELVLKSVEENNKELQAERVSIDRTVLDLSTSNNLPDPQLSGFYLPFGDHEPGDYTEWQFSQTVEFPTVYMARGNWIDMQEAILRSEYDILRQSILLEAKRRCLELIHLRKRKRLDERRLEQATKVLEQVERSHQRKEVGILELNKARITMLEAKFTLSEIESRIQAELLKLEGLNGGKAIAFEADEYISDLEVPDLEELWEEHRVNDPEMQVLRKKEAAASQSISLSRNTGLPSITAGFNRQGIEGAYYSGLYGGISIPLWSNRNNVKSAKADLEYEQLQIQAFEAEHYAAFRGMYSSYQNQLDNYTEYASTLETLNDEELLRKSHELGELSFVEYYAELQFYRDARDRLLQMEKELHQQRAKLMRHQH